MYKNTKKKNERLKIVQFWLIHAMNLDYFLWPHVWEMSVHKSIWSFMLTHIYGSMPSLWRHLCHVIRTTQASPCQLYIIHPWNCVILLGVASKLFVLTAGTLVDQKDIPHLKNGIRNFGLVVRTLLGIY